MAEDDADDVVLDDENGSFQNQSEESKLHVASAALGALVWKLYLRGQNLRREGNLREKIAQPELPKTSGQRKEQVDYKRCIYRSTGCLV